MAELGRRFCVMLVGNLALWVVCNGVLNMMDGKTFFGRKKKEKKDTYVDWKGNIHLGHEDFCVN